MSVVAVKRCTDYQNVALAIEQGIDVLGGLASLIKPGDRVLIKPNLCDPLPPTTAAITHPLVIIAIVDLVRRCGATPVIGENSAGNLAGVTRKSFEVCGIAPLARNLGVEMRIFQDDAWVQRNIAHAQIMKLIGVPASLADVNCIINVPKFKTHQGTGITGAVKNMFGCVHNTNRESAHRMNGSEFADAIVDVYSAFMPCLTIMDAVVAMEGAGGPVHGTPCELGYILIGTDGVAVDAVMAHAVGCEPLSIQHLAAAHKRKVGTARMENIEIIGDTLTVNTPFTKVSPTRVDSVHADSSTQTKVGITSDKCTRCGACLVSCPQKAIRKDHDVLIIDQSLCIGCLCCQEVCVHNAIDTKRVDAAKRLGILRLGPACNQGCLFCTVSDTDETDISTSDAIAKIDELVVEGARSITLTGGEPTVRMDLVRIIHYLHTKGVSMELQTNGVKLSGASYTLTLMDAGLTHAMVALHSHIEDVSNQLTQSSGYAETVQGIRNLIALNIKVSISHVLNELNYRDIAHFVGFIAGISAKIRIYFSFVRPNGRCTEHRALVPRLADAEYTMLQGFNRCQELRIGFAVEGVPLCYLHGIEHHSVELRRAHHPAQLYVGSGKSKHHDIHTLINSILKKKGSACQVCMARESCTGVWKEYAELHGTNELYPLFHTSKW